MATPTVPWEEKVAAKRAEQLACIPEAWRLPAASVAEAQSQPGGVLKVPAACGLLSAEELRITETYDATGLAEQLQAGQLTATAVATAFCKRAAIAHQLTNCLTEIFFDKALERAAALDAFYAKEGRTMGPLHGVPVSIKDSFQVTGYDATLGYVSFIGDKAKEDSPLVQILLDLGAVLYVKTNVPQTLMTADSDNNVFGRVLNPHKLTLTAGGSSGGEGALIAQRGSVLGVGTDIGGSIRIPAFCCGLVGFKPSAHRVPYGGQKGPGKAGSPGIKAAAGPLAASLRDCHLFLASVLARRPWDYDGSAVAAPWRAAVTGTPAAATPARPLVVGVVVEDPVHPLHPPAARALAAAVRAIAAAGHTVVALADAPPAGEALELGAHFFSLDSTKTWLQHIQASGEPVVPSVRATMDLVDKRPEGYRVEDVFDLNMARDAYIERWNRVWVRHRLDVIVGPGSQTTAVPHDTYGTSPYTTLWNLLDYPAVVMPVGFADQAIDRDELAKTGTEQPPRPYSAAAVDGAPTCVQFSARPLHDEELMHAATILAKLL